MSPSRDEAGDDRVATGDVLGRTDGAADVLFFGDSSKNDRVFSFRDADGAVGDRLVLVGYTGGDRMVRPSGGDLLPTLNNGTSAAKVRLDGHFQDRRDGFDGDDFGFPEAARRGRRTGAGRGRRVRNTVRFRPGTMAGAQTLPARRFDVSPFDLPPRPRRSLTPAGPPYQRPASASTARA